MQRCSVCNGRMGKTAEGFYKCINTQCAGPQEAQSDSISCPKCGDDMVYVGMNSYGEPNYSCQSCGSRIKL